VADVLTAAVCHGNGIAACDLCVMNVLVVDVVDDGISYHSCAWLSMLMSNRAPPAADGCAMAVDVLWQSSRAVFWLVG